MKELPILFSAPMVRAILAGTKSQTRRVVKRRISDVTDAYLHPALCPYGQPGDRLWVREMWRIGAWDEIEGKLAIDYCDGPRREWLSIPDPMQDDGEQFNRLWQQSTDDATKALGQQVSYKWKPGQSPCRWRPSIHMPRWASRITLEITGARVERLQDISRGDAMDEGCPHANMADGPDPRKWFSELWQSINGPGSWAENPWVWVVEFKRLKV